MLHRQGISKKRQPTRDPATAVLLQAPQVGRLEQWLKGEWESGEEGEAQAASGRECEREAKVGLQKLRQAMARQSSSASMTSSITSAHRTDHWT
jgi:hypothetical protein